MRRAESGGKCGVLDVSSRTSSCHVEPDEEKLNGRKTSITILAASSSRTLKKKHRGAAIGRKVLRAGNMSNQRARKTRYQLRPFPSLPRPGQRDKQAKRQRSPTKSRKNTGGLRFLDEFATRDLF